MGTRGLLGFIIAAQRYGSYNHYDSYPSGLGADIVKFLLSLSPEEYEDMGELVADITWVNEAGEPTAELQEKYAKVGFSDVGVGGQALAVSGELKHMIESKAFLDDNLFCEWAYFIDFENKKLETWASGRKLGEVSFDELAEGGVQGYLARFEDNE